MKGLFITFEGVECSGKSLQSRLLLEHCQQNNIPAVLVREPGTTPVGEKLRSILLSEECTGLTEFFILSASRAQLTETVILPKLQEGTVVICDRYFHSALAYQGYGRNLNLETLKTISTTATFELQPNITFHLNISEQTAASRLEKKHAKQQTDRIEQETQEFHNVIREAYLEIVTQYPYITTIDAEQDIPTISKEIIKQLHKYPHFK